MKVTFKDSVISFDRLQKQNGFLKKDLLVHETVCSDKTEPGLFDDTTLSKYGLKYLGRTLIPIKEVDTNDLYGQSVRDGVNPVRDAIEESIKNDGFKLQEYAPCAYKDADGNWTILEGRTRISILRSLGVSGKLLVNEYEKINPLIPDSKFGLHCNGDIGSPKGVASQEDLIRMFQNLIADGYLEFDETINQDKAKANFKKEVRNIMKVDFSRMKITGPALDKVLDYAMNNKGAKPNILPFNSREHALSHCRSHLGIRDDDKFVYVITTTDEWGFFKDVLPVWTEMRSLSDFRTIRVIVTKMAPSSVADWYLANIRVGRKMESHISEALQCWGNSIRSQNPGIEIYGTIPQCLSEAHKYPMDKLIKYADIDDFEYNLHGN